MKTVKGEDARRFSSLAQQTTRGRRHDAASGTLAGRWTDAPQPGHVLGCLGHWNLCTCAIEALVYLGTGLCASCAGQSAAL